MADCFVEGCKGWVRVEFQWVMRAYAQQRPHLCKLFDAYACKRHVEEGLEEFGDAFEELAETFVMDRGGRAKREFSELKIRRVFEDYDGAT